MRTFLTALMILGLGFIVGCRGESNYCPPAKKQYSETRYAETRNYRPARTYAETISYPSAPPVRSGSAQACMTGTCRVVSPYEPIVFPEESSVIAPAPAAFCNPCAGF